MSDEQRKKVEQFLGFLQELSNYEREQAFTMLTDRFCPHCGSEDGHRCYCRRDD